MIKVFVIHYAKLLDRKRHILAQFAKHNITDYEFVEIDRDALDREDTSMFELGYNPAQIAISLSHFYAYRQIAEKYKHGLVLEDDVILSESFSYVLEIYMLGLPSAYDALFIGDGCNLHIRKEEIQPGKYLYKKSHEPTSWGGQGATRCADSYVLSNACAKRLCSYIDGITQKINLPIDWLLNLMLRDTDSLVYWAEPTIVTQGTQNGTFATSY
jgi:GR25 family glycosyltransferase involved in LPS biosynthesis